MWIFFLRCGKNENLQIIICLYYKRIQVYLKLFKFSIQDALGLIGVN